MSEAGKLTENLLSTQETLKRREGWKYVLLSAVLGGRPHEFEFKLGAFIYDLALFDSKTLVEFDGPDHVVSADTKKDKAARQHGWKIERRKVRPAEVIHPSTLDDL